MGKRIFEKADFYLRRRNRKRLGRLLRKHRYLLNSDNSMLVYRAVWQYQSMLPFILSRGVHPDCKMSPSDGTPLMHAAAAGDLKTMRLLLEHGANPNARNSRNELPLGFACSYEHWEAAKLLVEFGADINGIESTEHTHLDWLTLAKNEQGIKTLRALGGLLYAELRSTAS